MKLNAFFATVCLVAMLICLANDWYWAAGWNMIVTGANAWMVSNA